MNLLMWQMDSKEKETTVAKPQKRGEQFLQEANVVVSETLNSPLKAALNTNYKKILVGCYFLVFFKNTY